MELIDLYDFLKSFGLQEGLPIKMYRHVNSEGISIRDLVANGDIDIFQAVQGSRQLGEGIVIFFAGEEGRMSRFVGARRILKILDYENANSEDAIKAIDKGWMEDGAIWHELEVIPKLELLVNRLAINWPPAGRHHLWLVKPEKLEVLPVPVHSIRSIGFSQTFPGFDELILSNADLMELVTLGDGGAGWIEALRSTRGVYLITDTDSGKLYVGSATGKDGIWGRWMNYGNDGHGGNQILKERCQTNLNFRSGLQFSILETLGNLAIRQDGLHAEQRWKTKFGKKATALNAN